MDYTFDRYRDVMAEIVLRGEATRLRNFGRPVRRESSDGPVSSLTFGCAGEANEDLYSGKVP